MAHPVMRHRVLVNFRAESEGITTDQIIDKLIALGYILPHGHIVE